MNPLVEMLAKRNPDAFLMEPRELYDSCVVDITDEPDDHWPRVGKTWVAVYDPDLCLVAMMESYPTLSYTEAAEWMSFNMMGAWMGDGTPTFRWNEQDLQ
jgi:hypothetical protein